MKTSKASIQKVRLVKELKMRKKRLESVLEPECCWIEYFFVNERKGIIIGGKRQNIKLAGKN